MRRTTVFTSGLLAFILLNTVWTTGLCAQQVNSERSLYPDPSGQQTKPLWEAGLLGGAYVSPKYPAAGQSHTNYIAAPYIIYRGERFRIGDGALARAIAVEQRRYELDLSVDGSFNANSNDNPARKGMPDLDYMFELGPQLKIRLANYDFAERGNARITLALPVRAVFSSDLSKIEQRGYIVHPELTYQHRHLFGKDTSLGIGLSSTWGTESLQDYFFQVDPQYQTPQRQTYDARGGYLGSAISVRFSFNIKPNLRLFISGNLTSYAGAANRSSPLFSEKYGHAFGLGFIWRLSQSETQVPAVRFN